VEKGNHVIYTLTIPADVYLYPPHPSSHLVLSTHTLETRTSGWSSGSSVVTDADPTPCYYEYLLSTSPTCIALHYFRYLSLFRFTCHIRVHFLFLPFLFPFSLFLSQLSLLHSAGDSITSSFCRKSYSFHLQQELIFLLPSAGAPISSTFCRSFHSFYLLQKLLFLRPSAGASIPSTFCRAPIPFTFCRSSYSFHLLQVILFLPPSAGAPIPYTF
jgi:hypothetical protein